MTVVSHNPETMTFFAVQLLEAPEPIDTTNLPALSIFQDFTLYAKEVAEAGSACHTLRLGFFADEKAAEHVARCLRRMFAGASVVGVSEMEWEEADDLVSPADDVFDDFTEADDGPAMTVEPEEDSIAHLHAERAAADGSSHHTN